MRKLASVRRVSGLVPIEGADLIELALIDGWQVVTQKNEYKVGDLCIYVEIDSWVPHDIAPFLTKEGEEVREYKGVKGNRLRTVKLRGCLSQGLLLPLSMLGNREVELGQDVSKELGIVKWERELPDCLVDKARGIFPSNVPKTDQERLQNVVLDRWVVGEGTLTEKLNGESCTFFLDLESSFHVCSKEIDYLQSESNPLWQVAIKYSVEEQMKIHGLEGMAIQGEIVGPSIARNPYKLGELDFYVFSMFQVIGAKYLLPRETEEWCEKLGLKHVPVISKEVGLKDKTKSEILNLADGKSQINRDKNREGLVYRSNTVPGLSFKIISNKWLLKNE